MSSAREGAKYTLLRGGGGVDTRLFSTGVSSEVPKPVVRQSTKTLQGMTPSETYLYMKRDKPTVRTLELGNRK